MEENLALANASDARRHPIRKHRSCCTILLYS
jgi:hypothetical protein